MTVHTTIEWIVFFIKDLRVKHDNVLENRLHNFYSLNFRKRGA
jgi:hypothetical protein